MRAFFARPARGVERACLGNLAVATLGLLLVVLLSLFALVALLVLAVVFGAFVGDLNLLLLLILVAGAAWRAGAGRQGAMRPRSNRAGGRKKDKTLKRYAPLPIVAGVCGEVAARLCARLLRRRCAVRASALPPLSWQALN